VKINAANRSKINDILRTSASAIQINFLAKQQAHQTPTPEDSFGKPTLDQAQWADW
jgi:hypothetical protein